MKTTRPRKRGWPRIITVGRESVTIYKRTLPNGSTGFQVVNYAERDADGKRKRRLDSYATEADAIDAATKLARQMSQLDTIGASMTREQSIEYASAKQTLEPFGIPLMSAVSTVAEAVKLVGDLSNVIAAAKFFTARNRTVTAKRVADAVAELIAIKESRGASLPYIQTLRSRLNRFAAAFQKDMGNVTTADIQAWLDSEKFQPVNYDGFRLGLNLLFKFGIARGYCIDNPVEQIERVKATAGETEIYTPQEIGKLLAAASPEFLPCLAIGAFAGLRSAEIERLEWSDIDFESKHITVGAKKSKTASRRVVPIQDNLAAWLARCGEQKGMVWRGTHDRFHDAQQKTADAAGLKWKQNALRHSYASYRLAKTQSAAQVALECGNSPQVIFGHYRELVKPAEALQWFGTLPEGEAAPVETKVVPVVTNRGTRAGVARLPEVGTAAAN